MTGTLNTIDIAIVKELLHAAACGPFFRDDLFVTLMGFSRDEMRQIAEDWPLIKLQREDADAAVTSVFFNLLYYPHRRYDVWEEWISADYATVQSLFDRWYESNRHRFRKAIESPRGPWEIRRAGK